MEITEREVDSFPSTAVDQLVAVADGNWILVSQLLEQPNLHSPEVSVVVGDRDP
jgi:hypothetical protein